MSFYGILAGILGLGTGSLGVWIWLHPFRVADFYRFINRPLMGQEFSARVFTERGAKAMGVFLFVFGLVFVIAAIGATASGA